MQLKTFRNSKTSDLKSISEYRHKKIRRSSLENQDGTGAVKKKTFVFDNYELNTNINKNKRKDEKLSQSESDSPDKKKQEKLKKKHKSHKEERWKISKTIKSPIRYQGQETSIQTYQNFPLSKHTGTAASASASIQRSKMTRSQF